MKNKKIARKGFILALLICWVGMAFYGWKQTQADDSSNLQTTVIGYRTGNGSNISQTHGELAEKTEAQGYKVVFKGSQSGSAEIQALTSGSIDYARIGDTSGVSALAVGTDLTYVAVGGRKDRGFSILVHNDSKIDSAEDLAGKTIVYTQGASSQYLITKALAAAGLATDDVDLVNLDQSTASVAYADRTVDTWTNWDPATSQAEVADNSELVVNGSDIGDNGRSYIVVVSNFVEENEEATALLIKYTSEDMEWANENTGELVDLLTDSPGVDQATTERMASRHTYFMTAMTSESVSELQDIADLFYAEGLTESRITASDYA